MLLLGRPILGYQSGWGIQGGRHLRPRRNRETHDHPTPQPDVPVAGDIAAHLRVEEHHHRPDPIRIPARDVARIALGRLIPQGFQCRMVWNQRAGALIEGDRKLPEGLQH